MEKGQFFLAEGWIIVKIAYIALKKKLKGNLIDKLIRVFKTVSFLFPSRSYFAA